MFTNIAAWGLVVNVLVLVVQIAGFLKVIKNDLHHVQVALANQEARSNVQDSKMDELSTSLGTLSGKVDAILKYTCPPEKKEKAA